MPAAYDFRNPVFLTEVELRRLRMLHEDFIRYLSARLSLFLRMEFSLKMARLTTLTFEKFTESLPSPTHISLFKAEPLLGVGIIDVATMYGIGAIIRSKSIDFEVHLELWQDGKEYDRLGLTDNYTEILSVRIPRLLLPIHPGRNIAAVLEVAASNLGNNFMYYSLRLVIQ